MISQFEELIKVLKEIDAQLDSSISVFIIGGAALLHYGVGKGYTKDIDIIIDNPKDCEKYIATLKKLNFKTKIKPSTHNQLEMCEMLERKEVRFDVFLKVVCNGFSLSESMEKRAEKIVQLEKLTAYVCSKEDIVLFKSLTTDRPNDIEDSVDLIKRGINWKTLSNELQLQADISDSNKRKRMVWYFIERLQDLKEKGVIIHIEEEINEFYNKL